ncbi:MAG: hypothetical protein J6P93_03600 [Alphaproteobacteria bacterium]|nr:hypothetical protein [Alphaproteobacteria bacterium]
MGESGRHFDLLMNAGGDLMIAFDATSGKAVKPVFVYDGRNRGFLCKTDKEKIPFYPLPLEARSAMKNAKDILCVEVANKKVVAEYNASLEVRTNV